MTLFGLLRPDLLSVALGVPNGNSFINSEPAAGLGSSEDGAVSGPAPVRGHGRLRGFRHTDFGAMFDDL
jgi:hypothetical protein